MQYLLQLNSFFVSFLFLKDISAITNFDCTSTGYILNKCSNPS